MATKTTPQAVSATLRRAGFRPVPRTMEGLHVTRVLGGATVTADWNTPALSVRMADAARLTLTDAGYIVTVNPHDASILTVEGKADAQDIAAAAQGEPAAQSEVDLMTDEGIASAAAALVERGIRPTVPEVLPIVRAYRALPGNSTGGSLHVVLDDHNERDHHLEFCIRWAAERDDAAGVELARLLLLCSRSQRLRLAYDGEAL